jgi:hypothetical protein
LVRRNVNNRDDDRRRNVNANRRPDNGLGMDPTCIPGMLIGAWMKTYNNLYNKICSYDNLLLAFAKARENKTKMPYVLEFETRLKENLMQLQGELESLSYYPRCLTTFIVRDPKTRKISASDFRDRVVHHALCNIIGPLLQKEFIYDSFANQIGKGTHRAVKRFETFARKVGYGDSRAESRERELQTASWRLCAEGGHQALFRYRGP